MQETCTVIDSENRPIAAFFNFATSCAYARSQSIGSETIIKVNIKSGEMETEVIFQNFEVIKVSRIK